MYVQRQGCTLYDVFIQVLQHPNWSLFTTGDYIKQRYKEAIDYRYHLCNNIEPGTHTRHSDSIATTNVCYNDINSCVCVL